MEYKVKNGLFKHQLEEKEKFIAIKLFVNGWAVTDSLGNTKETIRKEDDVIQSGDWTASVVQGEVKTLRVGGVKEVYLEHRNGKKYVFTREKGNYLLGTEFAVNGINGRRTTLQLPEEMNAMDAMILFCILKMAEEVVSVV